VDISQILLLQGVVCLPIRRVNRTSDFDFRIGDIEKYREASA
jgi:hypothetical protein